jgi:predicted Zn-dependent protease
VRRRAALGGVLLAALALSACATRVAPIGTVQPFVPDADERELWARAGREAAAIVARVRPYDDPALVAYLSGLGERLTPAAARAAGAPSLRVAVIRDPTLGAFALPDGRLFVHTGLLAAVENEAQLALVLGREIAHVTRRHALAASRAGRTEPARYEGTAPLAPTAAAILGAGASLAPPAAITGYGALAEREADADGVEAVAAAGWDVRQAVVVWDVLGRDAVERDRLETLRLGTPAWLQARAQATASLVRARPAGGFATSDAFEAHRVTVSRENAVEDARAGRFALARRQLDRVLAVAPADATAHVYAGDLHRLLAQRAATAAERDAELEAARQAYGRARALDATRADVHRQLGLLHFQQGDAAGARAALQEYLRLAPGASDAARVAEYLGVLDR